MTASAAPVVDRPGPHASRRSATDEAVEGRLRHSSYLSLRDVSCDVRAGVARLRGHLPTYYLKQMAQHLAAEVDGVRQVVNQIEVIAPAGGRPGDRPRRPIPVFVEFESEPAPGRKEPCWS